MKLSEAIRLGAMLKPQGRGSLSPVSNGVETTCAFGAAFEAAGLEIGPPVSDGIPMRGTGPAVGSVILPVEWYALVAREEFCPACFYRPILSVLIPHLNDYHGWTREAIADFVESLELHEPCASDQGVEVTVLGNEDND